MGPAFVKDGEGTHLPRETRNADDDAAALKLAQDVRDRLVTEPLKGVGCDHPLQERGGRLRLAVVTAVGVSPHPNGNRLSPWRPCVTFRRWCLLLGVVLAVA